MPFRTYNNQWHIVDFKVFTPQQPLAPGLLWILEQLPGQYVVASDFTPTLAQNKYWASYNRMYAPAVDVASLPPGQSPCSRGAPVGGNGVSLSPSIWLTCPTSH